MSRKRFRAFLKPARRLSARAGEGTVHDLRVSARRLQQFLSLARPLAPAGGADRCGRLCRRVERLFSPVRNCDVAMALAGRWPGVYPEVRALFEARQRRSRARKLRRALKGWSRIEDGLRAALQRVESLLDQAGASRFLGGLERLEARAVKESLAAASSLTPRSPEEDWHRLRKSLRSLRYAWESRSALTGRPTKRGIERLVRFQRILGDTQDLHVLGRKLRRARGTLLRDSIPESSLARLEDSAARRRLRRLEEFASGIKDLRGLLSGRGS